MSSFLERDRSRVIPLFVAYPVMVRSVPGRVSPGMTVVSLINGLVRDRARAAALPFDLGSVPGFGVLSGFGFGLGFPFDVGGVFAAGLPFGVVCCDALRGLVCPR